MLKCKKYVFQKGNMIKWRRSETWRRNTKTEKTKASILIALYSIQVGNQSSFPHKADTIKVDLPPIKKAPKELHFQCVAS